MYDRMYSLISLPASNLSTIKYYKPVHAKSRKLILHNFEIFIEFIIFSFNVIYNSFLAVDIAL